MPNPPKIRTIPIWRRLRLITHIVASGLFTAFALIEENALYLAGASSVLVMSISLYRIERLEVQIAELRDQRSEGR